ncbi:MAG: hypothetical protein CL946_06360 [Ectothiorhodospiraceae bacterium]|nr:hypothetical protein [Ectothiorhodospiraceae bacterium]
MLHVRPAILLLLVTGLIGCSSSLDLSEVDNYDNVEVYNLGGEVNSEHSDYCAELHGDRLLFTSDRPTVEGYMRGEDFWFTDRQGRSWTKALNLGADNNTNLDEGSPNIVAGGEEIYFVVRDSEDGLGEEDIYHARLVYNGNWENVRNLGEGVNTDDWDSHPFLSPDGEELYFASDRSGGYGGTDIYVATRTRTGKWGRPRNLGPEVNSSGDEDSPMLAPDGETLYFASEGHPGLGGFDIFYSKKADTRGRRMKWSNPKNIGRPFNSRADDKFFRLSAKEDTVFLSSSRQGGLGKLDIYALAPNPFKDTSRYIYYIAGMVYDTTTMQGIRNSKLKVKPENGPEFTIDLNRGRYRFKTKLGAKYTMTGSAEDFITKTKEVEVPQQLYYNEYRKSFGLIPIAKAETDSVTTPTDTEFMSEYIVYFDLDKSNIKSQARDVIQRAFDEKMKSKLANSEVFDVILHGYACDLGQNSYNINLSRRRGAAVSRVLRDLGVPLDAISVNAHGEIDPGRAVTEEEREMNRRVEILVMEDRTP